MSLELLVGQKYESDNGTTMELLSFDYAYFAYDIRMTHPTGGFELCKLVPTDLKERIEETPYSLVSWAGQNSYHSCELNRKKYTGFLQIWDYCEVCDKRLP